MIVTPTDRARTVTFQKFSTRTLAARSRGWPIDVGWLVLCVALAPALAAVWTTPWFLTQDGPTHVYNAHVLASSFRAGSPFGAYYEVHWRPIPNWMGHLTMAGLLSILPARAADRAMTTITLVGFAAGAYWLRRRVVGPGRELVSEHEMGPALLAALIAMNIAWLFGFHAFLLGSCLGPITLGYWWPRRDDRRARGVAGLSALLVLGYFCHLVSLGLTVLALFVLAATGPEVGSAGRPGWRRVRSRMAWLAVAFLPLVPLGICYLVLAREGGGPMRPEWQSLSFSRLVSLGAWKAQLTWADPLTLCRKDALPFTDRVGAACSVFAPALWFAAALFFGGVSIVWRRFKRSKKPQDDDRRGWRFLAFLLIVGGLVAPDTLGPGHGQYLPQRVVLLGLAALAIVWDFDPRCRWDQLATIALALAVAAQSLVVWDYARHSDRVAGALLRDARELAGRGRGHRIVVLPASIRSRFRANPLLHAGDWLGVETGNIVWNNYEARHYYFPVRFRPNIDRPDAEAIESIIKHDDAAQAEPRSRDWEDLLSAHATSIDAVIVYKRDERLEAITARWFPEVSERGDVRVFQRTETAGR